MQGGAGVPPCFNKYNSKKWIALMQALSILVRFAN
jgi:hypothetical protein